MGQLGLAAATLHLGRPLYAYRAILGFRHSWLSREVIAFSLFAGASAVVTMLMSLQPAVIDLFPETLRAPAKQAISSLPTMLQGLIVESVDLAGAGWLGLAMTWGVALLGLIGVGTSVMVYHVCRRPSWQAGITASKFFGTTVVFGLASWVAIESWSRLTRSVNSQNQGIAVISQVALIAVVLLKMGFEKTLLVPWGGFGLSPMRRSALLVTEPLGQVWRLRCGCAIGAAALATIDLITTTAGHSLAPWVQAWFWTALFAVVLVGELLERGLFFAAVVRLKMPGK